MTRSLSIAQLKAHLAEALADVQQRGHEIVIEKHGKPVARLMPLVPDIASEGLLGLAALLDDDDARVLANELDKVVAARRKAKPRRVPRLQ